VQITIRRQQLRPNRELRSNLKLADVRENDANEPRKLADPALVEIFDRDHGVSLAKTRGQRTPSLVETTQLNCIALYPNCFAIS
jgi:hypothetical protein